MGQFNNEGYIWLSDANKPIIISTDNFADTVNGITITFAEYTAAISNGTCSLTKDGKGVKIPFIIEALFVVNDVSYQIKFIDGQSIVYSKDLSGIADFTPITYLPNRFGDEIKGLNFYRVWEPKQDVLCESMDVLEPTVDLFVGFKH
jgi:CRISPR type III-associated protein (TIGR04423 family)